MNREIKFRGKVGANWQYAIMGADNHTEDDANWEHFWYVVDRKTVGEYTGLKDKNDKEIYDGDIVRCGYFALNDASKFGDRPWENLPEDVKENDITTEIWRMEVKWESDRLSVIKHHIIQNPDVMGVEVLGNIYEHPQLLKSKMRDR